MTTVLETTTRSLAGIGCVQARWDRREVKVWELRRISGTRCCKKMRIASGITGSAYRLYASAYSPSLNAICTGR